MKKLTTRRQFIQQAGPLACGAAALVQPTFALAQGGSMKREKKRKVEDVSPAEDLTSRRPGNWIDLVQMLRTQHRVGRRLMNAIKEHAFPAFRFKNRDSGPTSGRRSVSPLTRWLRGIAWVGAVCALTVQAQEVERSLLEKAKQLFKPLPQDMATGEFPTAPARVALGRKLFFDPRLSLDGTVSCATCHRPGLYGTDALAKSIGVEHRLNARNAPTVLNAALQFKAHWIGDRANVEEQAMKALVGHASFGNPDFASVVRKINALPGYAADFKQAFPNDPEPVKPESWGKAIGAYERTLVTPSPFDAYLKGDEKALTSQAQNGLKAFIDVGCVSCHNGVAIGGSVFEKFGIFGDYWKETGSQSIDEGRFNETKEPADKYVFKVPSLRNVGMTPPYFHDGSVATLPQAVRVMGKVQLGKELTDQEINDLVAFLNSLTGELPKDFATEPVLPPQAFSATAP